MRGVWEMGSGRAFVVLELQTRHFLAGTKRHSGHGKGRRGRKKEKGLKAVKAVKAL